MLDHGERRDCFVHQQGAYATAFAGRKATADDAIVDCVEHFLEHNRTLTVVTSDFGLRARGRTSRRAPSAARPRVEEGALPRRSCGSRGPRLLRTRPSPTRRSNRARTPPRLMRRSTGSRSTC